MKCQDCQGFYGHIGGLMLPYVLKNYDNPDNLIKNLPKKGVKVRTIQ